jgi:hypothetical protein
MFEAWFYRALVLLEWIEHSTSPLPRGQGRTGKLLGIKRFIFLMTDSPDSLIVGWQPISRVAQFVDIPMAQSFAVALLMQV